MPVLSPDRLSVLSDAPVVPERDYVLYWQIMARRTRYNFALEHALDHAARLGRPLVVLEALRAGYPHASDRLHRWAIDGMADNAAAYARAGVAHLAYVEPEPGAGRGLLETLAARACVVVTDEFPEYFLPRMTAAAGRALAGVGARLEAVDGNGILRCAARGRRTSTRTSSGASCSIRRPRTSGSSPPPSRSPPARPSPRSATRPRAT
jgi:deoxyribodipyrimidine photo-lyase